MNIMSDNHGKVIPSAAESQRTNVNHAVNYAANNTANYAGVAKTSTHTGDAARSGIQVEFGNSIAIPSPFQNSDKNNSNNGKKNMQDVANDAAKMQTIIDTGCMTVMSENTTGEDLSKIKEEGFNISDMKPEDGLNTLEHIKATLASTGTIIRGFNDDLSAEELAQVCGGEARANSIKKAFNENDIPVTKENVTEVMDAAAEAVTLSKPSDGTQQLLIQKAQEPTIQNLYMASYSGMTQVASSGGYYAQNAEGYLAKMSENEEIDIEALSDQMKKIIEESGIEVNEDSLSDATWLVKSGIPLTGENLKLKMQLERIEYPVKEDLAIAAAAAAKGSGRPAIEGNLADPRNIYERAQEIINRINSIDEGLEQPFSNEISSRRMLEETRLKMMLEASVSLIKRGFTVDTASQSELVDALKAEEERICQKRFPDAETAEEAVSLNERYEETISYADKIGEYPLAFAAKIDIAEANLEAADSQASAMANALKSSNAASSYEALQTEIRGDLGDSIKKAFRNADEVLAAAGLEANDANRRALRALSYNDMEVTEEAVQKVKDADLTLRRISENMTPASALSLIRDGKNPLTMTLAELEEVLTRKNHESLGINKAAKDNQDYAEFLLKAEANKDITEAERESYIGLYRLFRQIEKTDGAVIGAMVNTSAYENIAEENVSDLLRQVRSLKKKNLDYRIADDIDVKVLVNKANSIDAQISSAFDNNSSNSNHNNSGAAFSEAESYDSTNSGASASQRSYQDKLISEIYENFPEEMTDFADEKELNSEVEERLLQDALRDVREYADIDDEAVRHILEADIPRTIGNLISAGHLLSAKGNIFNKIKDDKKEAIQDYQKAFMEDAQDGSRMKAAGRDLVRDLQVFMENQIEEEASFSQNQNVEADTENVGGYERIKSINGMLSQLGLMDEYARDEHFVVPVETSEGYAAMHLTLRHEEGAGRVSVQMETEQGRLSAELSAENGKIYGSINLPGGTNLQGGANTFGAAGSTSGVRVSEKEFLERMQNYMDEHLPQGSETRTGNYTLYIIAKAVVSAARA
ncbi:MAG: hypothetical protein KBS85_06310 [Lachnospiraceae bacterium]|nr:hypothetical protein [Candidatus Merdinaster equi]